MIAWESEGLQKFSPNIYNNEKNWMFCGGFKRKCPGNALKLVSDSIILAYNNCYFAILLFYVSLFV